MRSEPREGWENVLVSESLFRVSVWSRVSEANLVKGWGPDGFAGGAGERRRSPSYWSEHHE